MHDHPPTDAPADRYMTVAMLADAYPAFPAASIRWLLFKRHENGLEAAVIRVGRRLLISENAWRRWLEGNREAKAPTVPAESVPPTRRAGTGGRRARNTAAT